MPSEFFDFLKERLQQSLPGKNAHNRMLPEPADNSPALPQKSIDSSGHPSGVLVPLYPGDSGELHVILTLRTKSIRHAGQISFPGGRAEVNETPVETALRETHEEVGIDPNSVSIAGTISPLYLDRSDSRIEPFVGFLNEKPALTRNPNEVEEIIIVKIEELLGNSLLKRETWELQNRKLEVPFWDIHRVPLWGATAMMLSELLELYQSFLKDE